MSQAEPDGLVALDALAERLVAGPRDLRVGVAATAEEVAAIARLRHRQVVVGGWAPSTAFPSGEERDAHDAHALQIAAWAAGDLTGAMRIVLPAAGRRLPVEQAFDLVVPPDGAVAEAGRLVVAPQFRGDPAHRIWGALFGCAWIELRRRGLSVLAGSASPRMVARLTALGLPFEVLGPARRYWGEERHPVSLDPAAATPTWFDARPLQGTRR